MKGPTERIIARAQKLLPGETVLAAVRITPTKSRMRHKGEALASTAVAVPAVGGAYWLTSVLTLPALPFVGGIVVSWASGLLLRAWRSRYPGLVVLSGSAIPVLMDTSVLRQQWPRSVHSHLSIGTVIAPDLEAFEKRSTLVARLGETDYVLNSVDFKYLVKQIDAGFVPASVVAEGTARTVREKVLDHAASSRSS